MHRCIFLEMINCFLHKGILGERNVPHLKIIYYSMHISNTCIICNYMVIYVITWENNESQLHSRRTWIKIFSLFSSYFAALNCLTDIRISHRYKKQTNPDLPQDFLISYRISWADDTDVSESLLLPYIFWSIQKGQAVHFWVMLTLYHCCTWASSGSAMGSFLLKKPTHISFIPSSKNS